MKTFKKKNYEEAQRLAKIEMIRKQAVNGDSICADLLSLSALNSSSTGGHAWIDTQIDMEEDDDDFRPY